jgi:hypothetical protein
MLTTFHEPTIEGELLFVGSSSSFLQAEKIIDTAKNV